MTLLQIIELAKQSTGEHQRRLYQLARAYMRAALSTETKP